MKFATTAATLALAACSGSASNPVIPAASAVVPAQSLKAIGSRKTTMSTTPAVTTEQATPAGKLYDSIGVNVHIGSSGTAYANFSQMMTDLQNLGAKHLRDSVTLGQSTLCQENQQLGAAGFKMTDQTYMGMQPADFKSWASCAGSQALDTFEAPNEWDNYHPQGDSNWAAEIRSFSQMMYGTVRQSGDPAFRTVALIGPGFANSSSYQTVGDLSGYEDYGNMHDYFAGRNPGTPGWGDNGYGSIPWNLNNARPAAQSRPIIATETGWGTSEASSPGNNMIHEYTEAEYGLRLYFEQFAAGVPQTYLYELYDESQGGYFSTYGLIRGDGSYQPHWSYYALRNMNALIKDPYSPSSSASLKYSLGGDTSNIHHLLMSKADGTLILALWQEAQDVNPDSNQYSYPASQNVTLTLANTPRSTTVIPSMMTTNTPSTQSVDGSQPISLSIGADVSFVKITY